MFQRSLKLLSVQILQTFPFLISKLSLHQLPFMSNNPTFSMQNLLLSNSLNFPSSFVMKKHNRHKSVDNSLENALKFSHHIKYSSTLSCCLWAITYHTAQSFTKDAQEVFAFNICNIDNSKPTWKTTFIHDRVREMESFPLCVHVEFRWR